MAASPEPAGSAAEPHAKPQAPSGSAPGACLRGSPTESAGRGGGGGGVTSRGSPLALALGGALVLALALLGVCLWQVRAAGVVRGRAAGGSVLIQSVGGVQVELMPQISAARIKTVCQHLHNQVLDAAM